MQQDVTDPLYQCFWRRKCSYAAEGLQLFITAVNWDSLQKLKLY